MGQGDGDRGKKLAADNVIRVLPLGFCFNPSEEQLVSHYLKRKINGIDDEELEVIPEVDLYKCEPWDLPDKSFLPRGDKQWFFFSPCDRKYPNSSLTNRATEAGYWKATGRDCKIRCRSILVGVRKTLVFYKGRPPRGEKTEWLMHEYRLDENECEAGAGQNDFVLCHVLKTSGAKIGAQHSAPIQKCDSSPKSGSPSFFPSDNEETAKGKSKALKENQTNSSLWNFTDDGTLIDRYLGILLDETDSESVSLTPDEDTISTQVDASSKDGKSQCDSVWPPLNADDFPQVPDDLSFIQTENMDAYYEEAGILDEILHAATQEECHDSGRDHYYSEDAFLNGNFIELNDLKNNLLDHEPTGIQLRPRTPTLFTYQQGSSSEGTSRRIHMQLYKMEASADTHHALNYCGDAESDLKVQQLLLDNFGQQKCNSGIITQNEISATGVFPSQEVDPMDDLSQSQSYDILDPEYFNSAPGSSDVSRKIPAGHCLTSMPPAISVTEQTCDSKIREQACFQVYALASAELPTAEYMEKVVSSVSENPIEVSTRGVRLDENSISGKSLADSDSKSLDLGPERKTSEPNTSKSESLSSPNGDPKSSKLVSKILSCIPARPASAMELTANLRYSKYTMGAGIATDLNSRYWATASGHATTTIKRMGSKGEDELPESDMISSGLRHRAILEPNDSLSGDKDKMKGLLREPVEISTDKSVSSVHPRYCSSLFSWLRRRISLRRSRGSFLVTCMFGTAFLFFCFMLSRIIWLFVKTFSTIAF